MKKTIFCILLAGGLYACGGNASDTAKPSEEKKSAEADLSSNPDYAAGLDLVAKSDCLTCHKLNEASTGPSYASVAAKYSNTPETIDTLVHKIIKGGSGNWGAVPMTPHPTLSVEDATKMVKYILLHKK